jgi:hypothetical protein
LSKGPGRRQSAIRERVERLNQEGFGLLEFIRVELGREPTISEYNSYYRAARTLEKRHPPGCRLARESQPEVTHPQQPRPDGWLPRRLRTRPDGTLVGTAHTQPQIVVYRPGAGPAVSVKTRPVVTDGHALVRRPGLSGAAPVVVEGWDQAATTWLVRRHYAFTDPGAWAIGAGGVHQTAKWGGHDHEAAFEYWAETFPVAPEDDEDDREELPAETFPGPHEPTLHDYDDAPNNLAHLDDQEIE